MAGDAGFPGEGVAIGAAKAAMVTGSEGSDCLPAPEALPVAADATLDEGVGLAPAEPGEAAGIGCGAGTLEPGSESAVFSEGAPLLSEGLTSGKFVFALSCNPFWLLPVFFPAPADVIAFPAGRERPGAVSPGTEAFAATAAKDAEEVVAAMPLELIETGFVPFPAEW